MTNSLKSKSRSFSLEKIRTQNSQSPSVMLAAKSTIQTSWKLSLTEKMMSEAAEWPQLFSSEIKGKVKMRYQDTSILLTDLKPKISDKYLRERSSCCQNLPTWVSSTGMPNTPPWMTLQTSELMPTLMQVSYLETKGTERLSTLTQIKIHQVMEPRGLRLKVMIILKLSSLTTLQEESIENIVTFL